MFECCEFIVEVDGVKVVFSGKCEFLFVDLGLDSVCKDLLMKVYEMVNYELMYERYLMFVCI